MVDNLAKLMDHTLKASGGTVSSDEAASKRSLPAKEEQEGVSISPSPPQNLYDWLPGELKCKHIRIRTN